jgi:hypothetical protein
MIVAHVDRVGTYPLQGEDFGEDLHDSGGSRCAVAGSDRGRSGTPCG